MGHAQDCAAPTTDNPTGMAEPPHHDKLPAEEQLRALNAQLTENTRLLETTLTSISQGILLIDAEERIRKFNPRVCELLNLPERFLATHPTVQEVTRYQLERGDLEPQAALYDARTRSHVLDYAAGAAGLMLDHYLRATPDGRTLEVRSQALPDGGIVRTFSDVTDYVQAEAARQRLDHLLEATQTIARVGGWERDFVNGSAFWTPGVYRILELSEQEFTPGPLSTTQRFFTQASLDQIKPIVPEQPTCVTPHDMELEMVTATGRPIWVRFMGTTRWEQGKPVKRTSVLQDITERKAAEAVIRQQAYFDALTGLPNRRMLHDRLEQEIKKSKRENSQLALLFIDLDHFKEVNDTLGHNSGDLLLVEAARRIQACVRETDTVARMGGDEFTVILTELADGKHLEGVLQKLLKALADVFQLGNEQVFVSASIGITIYPLDATEIENLLKNADQALYVAKGAGRNRFSFFTQALQEAAQTRVRLANDLRTALADQQFRVVYQPIVELATGAVHKAEALIRWQHPTRGLVSPAEFIPIAEASGLIVDIGEWVFQQAADQVRVWRRSLSPEFQISVNRSPVQFQHDGGGKESWAHQLQARGLPGSSIVVEITEGLLLDTSTDVTDQLLELGDAGIQVSLDDFGTGYSSLSYLQRFAIDYVKIDQSFVRHLIADSTDLALCKAIIVMAHALGMKVIAEGVETPLQHDLLLHAGCDYAQGYLFSRPVAASEFEAFMAAAGQSGC